MTDIKVAVIGAGSWGTGIAALLGDKGYTIRLRARRPEIAEAINSGHFNPAYLTDIRLPRTVSATTDFSKACNGASFIVFAVPSHAIRKMVRETAKHLGEGVRIISLAKGIEDETFLRMSQVISEEMPDGFSDSIAVLSGPNHAEEVSKKIPSATVVSSTSKQTMTIVQDLFMTPYFRVYTNKDIVGVEIGGASKNVIAIAAGMSDGLGFGDNTKASLMTRGLAEMSRLGISIGANLATFSGLSGMGDLIATCISRHSRNRGTGEKIAKGKTIEEIKVESTMVAEGIIATKVINAYSKKLRIELPITNNLYEVLYNRKDPHRSVTDLMERGPTTENLDK